MSPILDQCYRVDWTESILRTGIPPANPLYWYQQPVTMHNYYFWYVICAAIARISHLPVRVVLIAGAVWAGFLLAALTALYLKHFLMVGARLRRQFLLSISLFAVTGLDICVILWNMLYLHRPPVPDLEAWSKDAVVSWLHTLLWAPHHIASMVCCMLAFLMAWISGKDGTLKSSASLVLIAATLASAFGLSIYVTFAFFLVTLVWGIWQLFIERAPMPVLMLAGGGAGASVLLIPYLRELTHTTSGIHGGSTFGFAVREMIPPDGLIASRIFQHLEIGDASIARNLANLVLLVPGYAIELGFFFAVLLIFLIPSLRGRMRLSPAQRALVVIICATIPFISFMRSDVLKVNDFGWRAALLVQFPLLLLASELITGWSLADRKDTASAESAGLPYRTPRWLRSMATLALVIGAFGVICQALMLRFTVPIAEASTGAAHDPKIRDISHNLYISTLGYAQLDASIPHDAIVQFNPSDHTSFWDTADMLGVDHQIALSTDRPWCGAELGGDPSGCEPLAAAIDPLFQGANAEQARMTCRNFGIQYLVARITDPAWNDKTGWVWTLKPVVQDAEFRALDCRYAP